MTVASKPVTMIILGGGQRGVVYADYATKHPELAAVVAVADPREGRRKIFQRSHRLPDDMLFDDWAKVAALPKFADAVVISVMDHLHAPVVSAFSKLGYHILVEKPMATSVADCVNMAKEVDAAGDLIFGVGHVLRYSPYNTLVKEVLDSGVIGEIVNIQHMEPVGNEHFSHSFVRGNWKSESETSFALMTKCCHDLDILSFYLSGRKPLRVSSFGSIAHFKPSKKPKEAGYAHRCLDCPAEEDCVWSAKKIYLGGFDPNSGRRIGWARVIVHDTDVTYDNVKHALETGPYGVCAYESGNDVVDHQVVNIEYDGGVTASMTMSAFTESECNRRTVIQGTKGELAGDMQTFTVYDFKTRTSKTYNPVNVPGVAHGGGDQGLSQAFIEAVTNRDQSRLGITTDDVLNSHLIVFAAEKARKETMVVDFGKFKDAAVGVGA